MSKEYRRIQETYGKGGAGLWVLVDPDKLELAQVRRVGEVAGAAGADALLVGGSLLLYDRFEEVVRELKAASGLAIILFPGSTKQISPHADAILFLSLLSGRNPTHLIGEQVLAAPLIKNMKLEAISTAYLLIESGSVTSAEFMSGTRAIPRDRYGIALAHAQAAELLGFKMIYLEAGSGAKRSVPDDMIRLISRDVQVPLIVGGGIRSPESVRAKVDAGATFVVAGTAVEEASDLGLLEEFVAATQV